jgi:Protein of unknown function (DUF2490)
MAVFTFVVRRPWEHVPNRRRSLAPWRALCATAILLAGAERAGAGEVWSWHALDVTVLKTPLAEVTLHGRLRTGRSVGTPQQGRAGVITKFGVLRNVTLIAGYYYGKEEDSAEEWQNFHRVFTGVEVPVFRKRALSADTRGVVERFFVVDGPQFSRYRHRVRLRTNGRVGPYLSSEWFFVRNGYLSGRYGAGVRWRCSDASSLEIGYLYDARRQTIGEPRHVIVTQFNLGRLW